MKSGRAVVLCVVTLFAASGPARSQPMGGLAAPLGGGGVSVSAALGYAERDVENGRDDELKSRKALLRAAVGLLDGLDLHATFGFGDAELGDGGFEGRLGETFGAGVRWGLLNFAESSTKVVLGLQGAYSRSEDGEKTLRGQTYEFAAYAVHEVGAVGRVGYFYPFAGLRASYARYAGSGGAVDVDSSDWLGLLAGADYFVNPQVFFSGELHLFDETAIYLTVGYRH